MHGNVKNWAKKQKMKVYFNIPIDLVDGAIWEAQNGATRPMLILVNKTGQTLTNIDDCQCQLGFLEKGNHRFIFLNHNDPADNRVMGVFLNKEHGYSIVAGDEIFSGSSVGGPGNSKSMFGIYKVGAVLEIHSYKNRKGSYFMTLTENGWRHLPIWEVYPSQRDNQLYFF